MAQRHHSSKFLLRLAGILGLLPLKSLDPSSRPHVFTLRSAWSIWCLLILTYNMFSAQSIIMGTLIATNPDIRELYSAVKYANNFMRRLTSLGNISFAVEIYAVYCAWFVSLPKLIKLINLFHEYDQKFRRIVDDEAEIERKVEVTIVDKILVFFRWLFWILSAVTISWTYVIFLEFLEPQLKHSSWLYAFTGNTSLFFILPFFHMILSVLTIATSTELFLSMTGEFGEKLDSITDSLCYVEGKWIYKEVPQLHSRITTLCILFDDLEAYVGIPALVIAATHFMAITLMVFIAASIFFMGIEIPLIFLITTYVYILGYIYKLTLVANAGEKLRRQGGNMKAAILALPDARVPKQDHETLHALQKLVKSNGGEARFQLTACKFFKLNRGMIISLIAVVCSYNVIIIQFQLQAGESGEIDSSTAMSLSQINASSTSLNR